MQRRSEHAIALLFHNNQIVNDPGVLRAQEIIYVCPLMSRPWQENFGQPTREFWSRALQHASFHHLLRLAPFPDEPNGAKIVEGDAVFLATSFSWWARQRDVPALAIPIDGMNEWLKPEAFLSAHHQLKLVAKECEFGNKSENPLARQASMRTSPIYVNKSAPLQLLSVRQASQNV